LCLMDIGASQRFGGFSVVDCNACGGVILWV
jgi:hypothetical protein